MKHLVLIVDDEPILRAGLVKLVEMTGHLALTAGSVRQAMEQLAHHPSHVFLDMNLADGHGTTVLRHIRAERLATRVAILSGSSDSDLMAEAKTLNPDAIFRKPTDWSRLIAWLDERFEPPAR